jgi:hypothetical protein
MKDKILFAIALMCTVLLTSCGDDDNGSSIVGVWKCKSVDTGGWGNYARSRINVGDIIIFKNDNTYTITGNYNESGEYTVNGNTLTGTSRGVTIPYEIVTLSSTTLAIRLKALGLGLTFSRYSGGIPSTYNMNVDIDANASSKTIELTDLKTIIATATSSASWLTVSKLSYSSDSRVQIKAVANTSTSSRNCTVTVTAIDGNKVIINVIQNGASDQPQTKDEVSDQQPYSMDLSL